MRRPFIVVAAAALVTLAGVGPAQAKGPDRATISGPGIDTMQITFPGPDGALEALLRDTRFWQGVQGPGWRADPPAGDLGPEYMVIYRVPDLHNPDSGKADTIRQAVYPFAEAGPVVFMPTGQTMYDTAMPAGWLLANERLTGTLTGLGASRSAVEPASDPVAAVSAATESDDGSARPWALAAVGAGVVALGAAALVHTRRRAGRA
jgi:hypothetical protein